MEISGYGVTLRRLTEDKIEMVRNWRNDQKIQQYMEFRDYITPEMQKKWFDRINNDNNYYFLIVYKGKEIGLVNVKDIDYEKRTGEPGIFIYEDEFLNSDVSFRAILCRNDFIWDVLELKEMYIHVLSTNKRAIRFNTFFGYKLAEKQENVLNQKYTITKEESLMNKSKILKLI